MTKLEQMEKQVIEQADKLGVDAYLVEQYMGGSEKAGRMIKHIVFGAALNDDVTTAQKKANDFMSILSEMRKVYRATSELGVA